MPEHDNSQTGDNRYAPPQAVVQDASSADAAGRPPLAGRGMRWLAAMLGGVLIMAVIWLIALFTPLAVVPDENGFSLWTQVQNSLIGFGVFLLLNGWSLAKREQTVGKMVFSWQDGVQIAYYAP